MWRRVANLEGGTANFIETEQFLENEEFKFSFLQIVDLTYKPNLSVISHEEIPKIVEHHFHDLMQRYGEIVAIDLDKHGEEGQLSAAYAAEMQNQQHVSLSSFIVLDMNMIIVCTTDYGRYVPFDFHHHYGSSNFDNMKILYDQISEDFEKQRYFLIDRQGNILEEQRGLVRLNYIDSLDRTNVTQRYLAQKSLNIQLQRIEISSSILCELLPCLFELYLFYLVWAEQGDEISLEYARTHALKGDLVRYGKQTITRMIKDGVSALSRYYLNNFQDGIRQARCPRFAGCYIMHSWYLPVASALIIGGLTATTFTLQQASQNTQHYVSTVLCVVISVGVMAIVKANGRHLSSRPRLCGLL
ncbi:Phosphoinositide phosphatase SAC8 [Glycine soja]|uniref:Phosphoinositide phosphatase SAC8 n=1 Tax=Glycine soja TaxID=3848 RepID=A0A445FVD2_GLYSO|nr:Phosphoinositide phosphatase SAC8 [Glycine soja]